MNPSIWATLGIEATRERADIRRAYAAKLKVTNPEDDPAGFQTLRSAYERALAMAGPAARATVQVRSEPDSANARDAAKAEAEAAGPKRRLAEEPPDDVPDSDAEASERPHRVRDWRPPDEPPETPDGTPPGSRRREWRPPDLSLRPPIRPVRSHVPPPIRPPDETDAARAEFNVLRGALLRAVSDPATPAPALRQALDALLAAPAMMSVDRHAQVEAWLAGLIADHAPRTDGLIDPAVAYFHWDEGRVGPRSNVGARVVARREDLRFLAAARLTGGAQQPAFAALTRKPKALGLMANRLTPGLDQNVGRFLAKVRLERPGVLASLDPAAVAWWQNRLSRPSLGPNAIWSMIILPLFFGIYWGRGVGDAPSLAKFALYYPAALGLVATLAIGRLYAVEWPRRLWRERWAKRAPVWATFAWAPGLVTVVLAAALIPASLIGTIVLGLIGILIAYWPVIVADPDRRKGARYPWQVRSAFSFTYLAIFWLLATLGLPEAVWTQMSAPVAAGAFGFVMGEGTLLAAWRQRLSTDQRRLALLALAATVALAAAAIVVSWRQPMVAAVAAALVVGAVLAHKTPAGELTGSRFRLRYYAMVLGWLGWFIVAAVAIPMPRPENALAISGLWLLTGVVVTCWAAFEPVELKPRKPIRAG